jgi:hypothetical protein
MFESYTQRERCERRVYRRPLAPATSGVSAKLQIPNIVIIVLTATRANGKRPSHISRGRSADTRHTVQTPHISIMKGAHLARTTHGQSQWVISEGIAHSSAGGSSSGASSKFFSASARKSAFSSARGMSTCSERSSGSDSIVGGACGLNGAPSASCP